MQAIHISKNIFSNLYIHLYVVFLPESPPMLSQSSTEWFSSSCKHRLLPFGSDQIKTCPPQWGLFILSTHLVSISKDAFTAFKCGFVLQLWACLVCWLHSVCLAAISILLLSHDHYAEWLHTNDPHNNCTSWGIFEAYVTWSTRVRPQETCLDENKEISAKNRGFMTIIGV